MLQSRQLYIYTYAHHTEQCWVTHLHWRLLGRPSLSSRRCYPVLVVVRTTCLVLMAINILMTLQGLVGTNGIMRVGLWATIFLSDELLETWRSWEKKSHLKLPYLTRINTRISLVWFIRSFMINFEKRPLGTGTPGVSQIAISHKLRMKVCQICRASARI